MYCLLSNGDCVTSDFTPVMSDIDLDVSYRNYGPTSALLGGHYYILGGNSDNDGEVWVSIFKESQSGKVLYKILPGIKIDSNSGNLPYELQYDVN